ncbi:MAG: transposase [Ktedonobacteraceae bacterium]|nr:transposase [Ktedonobacteraceae bacterium]
MAHNCRSGYCSGEQLPQRKTLRLQGYDYSRPGFYFVTICTRYHTHWFGDIINNKIVLSSAGTILQSVWNTLPGRFPGLKLDQFVVMPNHIHGIIVLTEHVRYSKPGLLSRPTLSDIICDYKGAATFLIRRTCEIPEFAWQTSFYDIIIRDKQMLQEIRFYILNNPERWIASLPTFKDG